MVVGLLLVFIFGYIFLCIFAAVVMADENFKITFTLLTKKCQLYIQELHNSF